MYFQFFSGPLSFGECSFNKSVMSNTSSLPKDCRNLFSHGLGMNTGFPSVALASTFSAVGFSCIFSCSFSWFRRLFSRLTVNLVGCNILCSMTKVLRKKEFTKKKLSSDNRFTQTCQGNIDITYQYKRVFQ